MNRGVSIFKKHQRLQGGTGEVRDKIPPFFENGKWWWERFDDEQGHVPLRPMSEMPENEEDLSPEELRREQEDYKRRLRESKYIQAQGGTSKVQGLAGGDSNLHPGSINDQYDLPTGEAQSPQNMYDAWLKSVIANSQASGGITGGQDFSGSKREGGIDIPPADIGARDPGELGYGPFTNFTPEMMSAWHSGQGISQLGYPSFTGNTAGPGGDQLAYNTTSYDVPGFGYVPQANLANAQASNNLWDYLNPFGHTSEGGANTGGPTQRNVGRAVGTASNFFIPGSGFITGPIARYITSLIQHGMSPQQAVKKAQAQDSGDTQVPMPSGSVDLPTRGGYDPGAGADPMGNPTTGRQWYSQDFGRAPGMSPGNYNNPLTPGGGPGTLGTGFGTGTVGNFATAIGFDRLGAGQGSTNLSAMGGGPAASQARQIMKGIYTPMTGYGYGPLSGFTGTQAPSAQANIAGQQQLHDILMANPGALSGPISGNITRGVPMKQSVQMGSSDITSNPGLRLFMAGQGFRKPKPKKPKI